MYKILLVDDEAIVKISMQKIIAWEKTGFEITGSASNGLAALRFMEANPIDAVITDLQMAGMDGISLIRTLRQNGFSGPILALSNYSDYNMVRGALTEGAFDYLLKVNLHAEDLLRMLEKMAAYIQENTNRSDEAARTSALIAAQKRDLSFSALRNYLLDAQDTDQMPDVTSILPETLFPATVCTILIHKDTVANAASVSFLETVANEIFEDVSPIVTLAIHHNELLCLVSENELVKKNKNIYFKLTRLDKQLRIFSSATPLIAFIRCANDLPAVKQMYWICTHSYERLYYNFDASPLELVLGGQKTDWIAVRSEYITDAIANMRENNWEAFRLRTESFIALCRDTQIPPSQLTDAIGGIFWYGHDLKLLPGTLEWVSKISLKLKNTKNIDQLNALLQESLFSDIPRGSTDAQPVRRDIQRAMQYVNEYYMNKLTLDDVADYVGLNREYLSRLFRAETGISLFHYITEVRMRKASELIMANKDILIKEVALSVGFDNPYFFSKKFKNFFGVSPTNYYDEMTQTLSKSQ